MSAISLDLPQIANYQTIELIHQSDRTLVYRACSLENEQPVVIKFMGHEYPSFNELVQFRNQYAIALNLEIEGIVKPYALERYRNGYALVMEDIGGISLAEYQHQVSLSLEHFLEIAIQLAEILHSLHQNQIIHKDIKPANILIRPETQTVKLIDFSISSLLPKETQSLQTPNVLEGTLAYLSPEQTGRMNRGIDYRSDFYSLGVTFYELLTGKLPFESEDPLELVHAHIAKSPPSTPFLGARFLGEETSPESHRYSLFPTPLVDIVMKLMAKNAENRYQSALGLQYDLEKCRTQWQKTGEIEEFELGERDRSDRFLIPEKLYGRELEVKTLFSAFERVATGKTEMMLVAGYSGIGKTAVVNEVHKPITRQKGYFIKGKFDQFNRNIPFSAFVQAFRDLMGQLLGESEIELARWKKKILAAVGENGQVLVEVIPELENIIGEQPPVPELEGSAAQNRFNLLFEKFIAVFTTPEHPLTLFLDDLQWADSASLNLLKVLMEDNPTGYLLLLGAYRDNEVSPTHPLMLTLGELGGRERASRVSNATISTITLAPLSVSHINQLIAETLSCSEALATPLTDLVYQKTKGNPFFTTQFLKGLHEDEAIAFNQNIGYWECDLVEVQDAALTDDVVEFMAGRLQKLPEATQNVLKLAACIGNQFELDTLAIICEIPSEEAAAHLWSALREGLILPQSQAYKFFQGWAKDADRDNRIHVDYRFLHDRVQQAAYSLIDETIKPNTHLKLGRLLLNEIPDCAIEENIFDVINHLNLGYFLIDDEREKDELARLNLLAGRRAKSSTAYLASIDYFDRGIELLDNDWENNYDRVLSLYLELIESEYINTNFERSKTLADIAIKHHRSTLDRLKISELQIRYYIAKNDRKKAVDLGINSLQLLGIQLDRTAPDIFDIEALADLPEMVDPLQIMALRILITTVSAAVIAATDLLVPIAFTMVNICIRSGNSDLSPYAYGFHAWMLCSFLEEVDRGYRFGKLAIKLIDEFNAKIVKGKVYQQFNTFVRHYKEPLKNMRALVEAVQNGLEVGDIEYSCYAAQDYCILQFFLGQNLNVSWQEQKQYFSLIQQKKQKFSIATASPWLQLVSNLLHDFPDRMGELITLDGEFFDEKAMVSELKENKDNLSLFSIFFIKLYLNYLFDREKSAVENGIEAEKVKMGSRGFIYYPVYLFYFSLALLAKYANANEREREAIADRVNSHQQQLEFWLENAPFTYQHKYDLVQAEYHRILNEKIEAIDLYDRAIAGAKANEYIQEEALANELAAKFYLDWGKEKIACTYMQEAYYCYARWGAKAKIDHLEQHYPQLLSPILQRQQPTLIPNGAIANLSKDTISSTNTATGEMLDLATLMKASRSLSEEIDLDRAIANFIQVIRENAGAETATLMLLQEETLVLAARATEAEMSVPNIPIETSADVPLTLVNQVKNTRSHLVLDDATATNDYAGDDYIHKHKPLSILCLPLIVRAASPSENRGKLIGILYLENNQAKGVFISDRIEILTLLCSQAAIALENAQLYRQAQQALTDLQQAQLQLVQNEKMATLGNLVAGVAHEINNPVGFISGNISAAQDYLQDLLDLFALYQTKYPTPDAELAEELEERDLEFICEDFPKLIASMRKGCDRIRSISTSLRTFSRTDTDKKTEFDLHEGLDSTLLILKYRLKANEERPAIQIIQNYDRIPSVKCYAGQINQVFMNLLANAIDALDASNQEKTFEQIEKELNIITIETQLSEDRQHVLVRIADNGTGMPKEIESCIFEQGFTTKGVGKGTGLGMAIALQIIQEKHEGTISCSSELGKGTEFIISLPIS